MVFVYSGKGNKPRSVFCSSSSITDVHKCFTNSLGTSFIQPPASSPWFIPFLELCGCYLESSGFSQNLRWEERYQLQIIDDFLPGFTLKLALNCCC